MAGRVRDIEPDAFQLKHVALFEIAIRCHVFEAGEAIALGGAFDLVKPELVVLVRADHRDARALADFGGGACVIEVAVCQPHRLQRQTEMLECAHERVGVAAWVDQDSVFCLGIPDQRAVLLKRCDRDDPDLEAGFGACFGHAL